MGGGRAQVKGPVSRRVAVIAKAQLMSVYFAIFDHFSKVDRVLDVDVRMGLLNADGNKERLAAHNVKLKLLLCRSGCGFDDDLHGRRLQLPPYELRCY